MSEQELREKSERVVSTYSAVDWGGSHYSFERSHNAFKAAMADLKTLFEKEKPPFVPNYSALATISLSTSPNDEEFVRVLNEALKLFQLSSQQFADTLMLSRTSVDRWVCGKNLPVKAMRGPIFAWINEQAVMRHNILVITPMDAALMEGKSFA